MTTMMLDRRPGIRLPSEPAGSAMPGASSEPGHAGLRVRRLDATDLPAVERHLLGLGPSDRRARFFGNRTDATIAAYARGLDPSAAILIGALDAGGRLVGLAEAHPTDTPHIVEIAVSVDPPLRRRGLGQRLVAGALAVAFARGAESAEFVFASDNRALIGLVRALGGRMGPSLGRASIRRAADAEQHKAETARHPARWRGGTLSFRVSPWPRAQLPSPAKETP